MKGSRIEAKADSTTDNRISGGQRAPGGPLRCQRSDDGSWDEGTATQSLWPPTVRAACQLCPQHQDAGGTVP
jgi:hypothetical protein